MDSLGAVHKTILAIVVACMCWMFVQLHVEAAELNTKLPTEQDAEFSVPITIDIPSQPLAAALNQLGKSTNLNIAFPSDLVLGKTAPAVKGRMSRKEALQRILANSGLAAKIDAGNAYIERASNGDKNIQLDQINVRAKRFYEVGPLPGLGLTKEEIPGNVQSITAKEIKESHSLSIADLMNSKLQSVTVNDYQGNPFQMDVNYRGFTASPQLGTAQGISVFFDGIRVNEPFGDVVNWDMIPMNALSSLDIFPGSNPIFGLGTLGGALTMRTKSGFDGKSLDAEVLAGSYGRKQLQISAGDNNGVIAGFVSGNFFLEDGWRDNSPSKVNQVFGKAEWQNERARLGLSMLYAGNKLTGNGLLPEQMAAENRSQVYTSPDESKNDLLQFQLSGIWDVTDNFNITGQIYKRNSKRKSKSTDVNENLGGNRGIATDNAAGRQVLYGYSDINNDGLPDYNTYAVNVAADAVGNPLKADGSICLSGETCATGTDFFTPIVAGQDSMLANDGSGVLVPRWTVDPRVNDTSLAFNFTTPANVLGVGEFNNPLPAEYEQLMRNVWQNQTAAFGLFPPAPFGGAFAGLDEFGIPAIAKFVYGLDNTLPGVAFTGNNYVDSAGFLHKIITLDPVNAAQRDPGYAYANEGSRPIIALLDAAGNRINRDGADPDWITGLAGIGSGYIDGTPTALITDTEIDQVGTGGALQLNWNLEKHKLMVGASVDMADASYGSAQYLGLLDAKRNGVAAPELLGYEFYARDAAHAIRMNDFKGDSTTKSIYASETWSPIDTLNITAAARLNWTNIKNQLDVNNISRFTEASIADIYSLLNLFSLCTGIDGDGDGLVDGTQCPTGINSGIIPGFNTVQNYVLETTKPEKFNYRSFNPSLGATWQASDTLNVYGNWNRGARTPSVIELGCAFDDTPIFRSFLPDGTPLYIERSLNDRRTCNLPSTMSGDPYLKQVRSKTLEMGARGLLAPNIEWNASVYRTDLKDDIYFVSVAPSRSFFQNIGDTKRQGLEMGLKGKFGKASFGLNYSLTHATFQSGFRLDSPYNSSAGSDETDTSRVVIDGKLVDASKFGKINVNKGNRIPGIPLHNLNANFSYEVTDKWIVGLNAVMHSSAFVRGNENNKHRAGPATPLHTTCTTLVNVGDTDGDGIDNFETQTGECDIPRADWRGGKTAGYTVFNLQTSYKLAPEWTLAMQVNNLFDKEYSTAGRLGLNAFSPGIYGAIGESGFNYNSSEWQGTSFLGLGAPRSAYFTLTYQFVPDKR